MPHTPLAMAVLKLLDERSMHPYEMQQVIVDRHLDSVFRLRSGSLYHTVERLEQAGLIESLETNREGRRPERTVYAITEAGRDEFHAWLRQLLAIPVQEYPQFAAALASIVHFKTEEVAQLLQHRALLLEAELAAGERTLRGLQEEERISRIHTVEFEYGQALRRAELGLVRSLVREIKDGTLDGLAEWRAYHAAREASGREEQRKETEV